MMPGAVLAQGLAPKLIGGRPDYRNPRLPVLQRVQDLLSRMTLEEKVAQLRCAGVSKGRFLDAAGQFSSTLAAEAFKDGMGQIGRPSDRTGSPFPQGHRFRNAQEAAIFVNAVQHHLVDKTRLGIPALFHEETAHGLMGDGATIFPIPPLLASTWDVALVEQIFAVTAREARVRGVTIGLSPVLDLSRDPRFGRVEEFFGEDPFLVGEMGIAATRGLQGRQRPIGPDKIFATLKHFIHGTPEGGINLAPADMSERTLRDTYLAPFKAVIQKADAAIVMPSYNEVQGIPAHANPHLLLDLGRKLLGFNGPYMSDYNAVTNLVTQHHMAKADSDAAVLAIEAGVDVELPEGRAFANLPALVRAGRIPAQRLDEAVSRILVLKFEAGLFENPYCDPRRAQRLTNMPADIALARTAAEKGIILLKNDGILPLDPGAKRRIAVIGPNATGARYGGYSGTNTKGVSILDGIRAAAGPDTVIEHADGVWITDRATGEDSRTPLTLVPAADNAGRIAAAVSLAERSDLVMLVVGDNEVVTRESLVLRSDGSPLSGDRESLNLFGDQDALVDAILATGRPVVALLLNGRPLSTVRLAEKANALLEGWYLGQEGGHAFANILFGHTNPSGKLAVSIPRDVGALPVFYNRHPSALVHHYLEKGDAALYPFGHGLSYTTFTIAGAALEKHAIKVGDGFAVTVAVTNIGKVDGEEVVQLYIGEDASSVPRPVRELKAFRKVALRPGEVRTLRFDLDSSTLEYLDRDMQMRVESGTFSIWIGNSSTASEKLSLQVVA